MPEANKSTELETLFKQGAPDAWKKVGAKEKAQLIEVAQKVSFSRTYSGPLPSPEDLEYYEQLLPGSAERFLKMVEAQAEHRMGLEKVVIGNQQRQGERGQSFAMIIACVLIAVGFVLTLLGHDWVGGTVLGGTLVSIVGTFITGKNQMLQNLRKKDEVSQ